MSTRLSIPAVVLLIFVQASLRAADTVEDVEKHVAQKWAKTTTFSADMVMTIRGAGPTPLKSTGSIKILNDEGVEKKWMSMAFDGGAPSQLGPIQQTVIFDGEFAWTIRKAPDGRQIVAKQRPDAMEGTPGGKDTFAQLREAFELKLLPDASVNGDSAFVIEATPKKLTGRGITKFHFYIVKESGILSKTVGFNAQDDEVNEIVFTNVKVNPELDPALFVAKFDPETKILDMTKQAGQ